MQTNLQQKADDRLHVGLIMDGNGRWAESRGRARVEGHLAGSAVVGRLVQAAPALGIGAMTLYAFSSDNWRRPPFEVAALMGMIGRYLRSESQKLAEAGIRLSVIGRRDRLPGALLDAIIAAEAITAGATGLHLRIAIDYSARDSILYAVQQGVATREGLAAALGTSDVDLVIRTGGEQRLSDFLLWECAYAEFHFTKVMWPDFSPTDLAAAIADFRQRSRRFGALAAVA